MSGAFGPIMATGVVLVTAAVVVANPVNAPTTDVRIPAIALSSGSSKAVDMLDEDFLRALAPQPAGSTDPVIVLKDLFAALVASAAQLGRNAIGADGGYDGIRPGLTAAARPYSGVGAADSVHFPTTANVSADTGRTASAGAGYGHVPADRFPAANAALGAALPESLEVDWHAALDNAAAAVSTLSRAMPVLGESSGVGDRLSALPDVVGSVRESLEAGATALAAALPSTAGPGMPAEFVGFRPTHHDSSLTAAGDRVDDTAAERQPPARAAACGGARDMPTRSTDRPVGVAAGRKGD